MTKTKGYVRELWGGRYCGKAINLTWRLIAASDEPSTAHDLLRTPPTQMKARPLPQPGAAREEIVERGLEPLANTARFDVSHHPGGWRYHAAGAKNCRWA